MSNTNTGLRCMSLNCKFFIERTMMINVVKPTCMITCPGIEKMWTRYIYLSVICKVEECSNYMYPYRVTLSYILSFYLARKHKMCAPFSQFVRGLLKMRPGHFCDVSLYCWIGQTSRPSSWQHMTATRLCSEKDKTRI
jgi:hypothetical protein